MKILIQSVFIFLTVTILANNAFTKNLTPLKKDSASVNIIDLKTQAINELATPKVNNKFETASVTEKDLLVLQDPGTRLNENPWTVSASLLVQKFKPAGLFKSASELVFNFDSLDATTMPAVELSLARNFRLRSYFFKVLVSAEGAYAAQSTQTYFKTGALAENSRLIMQSSSLGLGVLLSNPWIKDFEFELGIGQGSFNYSHQAKQDYASFSEDLLYSYNHMGLFYKASNSWGVFVRNENKELLSKSTLGLQSQSQSFGTRFIW